MCSHMQSTRLHWCIVGPSSATHSTSVRLDADTRARLDVIARRDDRSLAYVIKKAITEYLEREERKEQPP